MIALGLEEGPLIGTLLREIESWWVDSDFAPGRAALLARLKDAAKKRARLTMHLELIESFTIPGDLTKPNEDSFAFATNAAAVFDGATGLGERLMPGPSDAQWIAQIGARRLRAHAQSGEGEIRDWLRATAADTEKSFRALRKRPPIENYGHFE